MTILHFSLLRSIRRKSTLLLLILWPSIILPIKPFWTSEVGLGFSFFGMTILLGAFILVRSIIEDRQSRVIVRIFIAPITTFQYLFQNLLCYLILLTMQILVFIFIGSLLYNWNFTMTVELMLGYILFAATSISFSLAWNSLFKSKAASDGLFSILVSIMALLGGIYIPVSNLPDVLQPISMLFPTYWLSSIILDIRNLDAPFDIWTSIAVLILFTVAFLIFGSKRRL